MAAPTAWGVACTTLLSMVVVIICLRGWIGVAREGEEEEAGKKMMKQSKRCLV